MPTDCTRLEHVELTRVDQRPVSRRGARREPIHLKRTMAIALLVGTWLTFVNPYDVLISVTWDWGLAGKVLLNDLTPFVVANLGLVSHSANDRSQADIS
ncbi:MAG: hypothetical protein SVU69_12510 [Pseudomonadota bacterium]|nr:hypothetical protein [Pseudomonadota bacterium]